MNSIRCPSCVYRLNALIMHIYSKILNHKERRWTFNETCGPSGAGGGNVRIQSSSIWWQKIKVKDILQHFWSSAWFGLSISGSTWPILYQLVVSVFFQLIWNFQGTKNSGTKLMLLKDNSKELWRGKYETLVLFNRANDQQCLHKL